MKVCKECGESKPLELFVTKRRGDKVYYCSECRQCQSSRQKKYREQNKQKIQDVKRLNLYGITGEQFKAMLEAQGSVCAVCGNAETRNRDGVLTEMVVDHDHSCCPGKKSCGKCVRGLLCSGCNWVLGQVKDDTDRLDALSSYLKGVTA